MKIEIQTEATFCNTWPNLIIEINKQEIYSQQIEESKTIRLEFNDLLDERNRFVIGMNNKSFGKRGVWDTKTKDNEILQDKTLTIKSIKLDDVECMPLMNNTFHVQRADKQPSYFPDKIESTGVMNYNGYFTFSFDLPLYNSLINQKYKKPLDEKLSYFSNYSKVFHYDEEKEVINSIYDILKEVDEKFSDKRSKIRNT